MFPTEEEVRRIRERFPEGAEVRVDRMGDDPRPVAPGTRGRVLHVDDIGTVHCVFEDGRVLGLVPGEDAFHRTEPAAAKAGKRRTEYER